MCAMMAEIGELSTLRLINGIDVRRVEGAKDAGTTAKGDASDQMRKDLTSTTTNNSEVDAPRYLVSCMVLQAQYAKMKVGSMYTDQRSMLTFEVKLDAFAGKIKPSENLKVHMKPAHIIPEGRLVHVHVTRHLKAVCTSVCILASFSNSQTSRSSTEPTAARSKSFLNPMLALGEYNSLVIKPNPVNKHVC